VDGTWRTVVSARSAVGDGTGTAPYLLATLPDGTATGVRVVVSGATSPSSTTTRAPVDVAALGPGGR
jgi:hypothetical protein